MRESVTFNSLHHITFSLGMFPVLSSGRRLPLRGLLVDSRSHDAEEKILRDRRADSGRMGHVREGVDGLSQH